MCEWNSSDGRAVCRWPGVFSTDTHGGGRYFCLWHWRIRDFDKITRSVDGDEIVRKSMEWNGEAESYFLHRAETEKAAKGRGRIGAEEEGKPPVIRADAQRGGADEFPAKAISELVPDLQPEYQGEW